MRFMVFSDVHFHDWAQFSRPMMPTGMNSRLYHTVKAVETVYSLARNWGAEAVLFSGDFFHVPKISAEVLDAASRATNQRIRTIAIAGNHDLVDWRNSVYASRALSHITWLDGFMGDVFKLGDIKIAGVPYCPDQKELMDRINRLGKTSILLMHAGIAGSKSGTDYIGLSDEVPTEKLYGKADIVISGHYHIPQILHGGKGQPIARNSEDSQDPAKLNIYEDGLTVLVPGSPEQHNLSDRGSKRGCWMIDTAAKTLAFHKLDSPEFVKLDATSTPEDADGKYVHLVLPTQSKSKDSEKMVELYGIKASGLRVEYAGEAGVESTIRDKTFQTTLSPRDAIKKWIERSETTLDKERLGKLGERLLT